MLSARAGLWPATRSGLVAMLNAAVRNSDLLPVTKGTLFQLTDVGDVKHANATLMVPEGALRCGPFAGEIRNPTTVWRHLFTLAGRSTTTKGSRSSAAGFYSSSRSAFPRSTSVGVDRHSTIRTSIPVSPKSQYTTKTASSSSSTSLTTSVVTPVKLWTPKSSTFLPRSSKTSPSSSSSRIVRTSASPSSASGLDVGLTTRRTTPTLSTCSRTTPAAGADVATTVSTAQPRRTSTTSSTATASSTTSFTTTIKTAQQNADDEENVVIKEFEVEPQNEEDSVQMLEDRESHGTEVDLDDGDGSDLDDGGGSGYNNDVEDGDDDDDEMTDIEIEAMNLKTDERDPNCLNELGRCTVTAPLDSNASSTSSTFSTPSATFTVVGSSSNPVISSIQTTHVTTRDGGNLSPPKRDRTSPGHITSSPLTSSTEDGIQVPVTSASRNDNTATEEASTTEWVESTSTTDEFTTESSSAWTGSTEQTEEIVSDDWSTTESPETTEVTTGDSVSTETDGLTTEDSSTTEESTTADLTGSSEDMSSTDFRSTSDTWTTVEDTEETSTRDFFTVIIDLEDASTSSTSEDDFQTTATTFQSSTTEDDLQTTTTTFQSSTTTGDGDTTTVDHYTTSSTDETTRPDDVKSTSQMEVKFTVVAQAAEPDDDINFLLETDEPVDSTTASTKITTTNTTTKATTTTSQLTTTPFQHTSTITTTKTPTDTTTESTFTTVRTTTTATTTKATTTAKTTCQPTSTETSVDSTVPTTTNATSATTTTTTKARPISMVTPGGGIPFSIATPAVRSRTTVRKICPVEATTAEDDVNLVTPADVQSRCRCDCR